MEQLIFKVKVCEPIESLVDYLVNNGCEVIEQKVSDYHFHEVFIKMQSSDLSKLNGTFIEGINLVEDSTYSCSCHWSIVEIVKEEGQ